MFVQSGENKFYLPKYIKETNKNPSFEGLFDHVIQS